MDGVQTAMGMYLSESHMLDCRSHVQHMSGGLDSGLQCEARVNIQCLNGVPLTVESL